MDLGRGNLLFPNLWGDVNLLEDDDVAFLAEMESLRPRQRDACCSPPASCSATR